MVYRTNKKIMRKRIFKTVSNAFRETGTSLDELCGASWKLCSAWWLTTGSALTSFHSMSTCCVEWQNGQLTICSPCSSLSGAPQFSHLIWFSNVFFVSTFFTCSKHFWLQVHYNSFAWYVALQNLLLNVNLLFFSGEYRLAAFECANV